MQNFFSKIFIVAIAISLVACNLPSGSKTNKPPKIRIVDLQGHPHDVQMFTPELNAQALTAQGKATDTKTTSMPETTNVMASNGERQISANKYARENNGQMNGSSAQALQETLQMPQKNMSQNSGNIYNDSINAGSLAKNQNVEYDLKTGKTPAVEYASSNMTNAAEEDAEIQPHSTKGYFVQTGSFSSASRAKSSLANFKKFANKKHEARIEHAEINGKNVYRILIGPFKKKTEAKIMMNKINESGHNSIIIKNK